MSLPRQPMLMWKVLGRIVVRSYCPSGYVDQGQVELSNSYLYSGESILLVNKRRYPDCLVGSYRRHAHHIHPTSRVTRLVCIA